jgi:hypothetical protein
MGLCMHNWDQPIKEMWPPGVGTVDEQLPKRAADYLKQANDSAHVAPAGAIILAASAIDSMLKEKGYKKGSLYARIDQSAKDHIITSDMAQWAHEVRLEANDERHADENAALPTTEEAKRCVEFAAALGAILFTLPARIQRGIQQAKAAAQTPTPSTGGGAVGGSPGS